VYVGVDPITRKRVYLREAAKDYTKAQIVLCKPSPGPRREEPESGATIGQPLEAYLPIAEWGLNLSPGPEPAPTRRSSPSRRRPRSRSTEWFRAEVGDPAQLDPEQLLTLAVKMYGPFQKSDFRRSRRAARRPEKA